MELYMHTKGEHMKTVAFHNGLVTYIQCDRPLQAQLDAAEQFPGLLAMMPTHATRMQSLTWTIHKRPPQEFDETPFMKDGVIYITDEYKKALAEHQQRVATGDPDIDDKEPGLLVLADIRSLSPDQIEHAECNTNYVGNNLVILEYIGCESSSDNWYPDHHDTSDKTAFTDSEINQIFAYFDRNPNKLP